MSKGTKQYAIRIPAALMRRIRARMERRSRNPRLPPQTLTGTVLDAIEELLDLDDRRAAATKRAASARRSRSPGTAEGADPILGEPDRDG